MESIRVISPAKINIGLNIVQKRSDGFHVLETIFYPLKLHDTIEFRKSKIDDFTSTSSTLDNDKSNLILRAKTLLIEYSGKEINCAIRLEKNIPIGAGLGGGSSNAASTLLALNKLYELKLDSHLSEIALKLGSDVPFFLNPVACFASSRGEILQPIDLKINETILIVNPGIHISTKWAFENIIPSGSSNLIDKIKLYNTLNYNELNKIIKNDFEILVFKKFPEVRSVYDYLFNSGAELVRMTGTGSSVFGIFKDRKTAEYAAQHFNKLNYFTHIE